MRYDPSNTTRLHGIETIEVDCPWCGLMERLDIRINVQNFYPAGNDGVRVTMYSQPLTGTRRLSIHNCEGPKVER